jgi:hypothetical protein
LNGLFAAVLWKSLCPAPKVLPPAWYPSFRRFNVGLPASSLLTPNAAAKNTSKK